MPKRKKLPKSTGPGIWGRIMIVFTMLLGLGVTLGFWWQGDLKHKWAKAWEPEATIWQQPTGIAPSPRISAVDTSGLEQSIKGLVEQLHGRYVIYAKALRPLNPERYKAWEIQIGDTEKPMQAASLIKVPVVIAGYRIAERGEFDLKETYRLKDEDKAGGSGSLFQKPEGYELSWEKLMWHMGNESDNTAFRAMVNYLGEERLNSEFEKLGWSSTSIAENQISALELMKMFEGLYRNTLLNEYDSKRILASMVDTWYEDRIPVGVPDDIKVAHKVGTEIGVVSDAGIVYAQPDYAAILMTEGVKEGEAKVVLPEISQLIYTWLREQKI